jgi:hypothetical protein
MKKELGIFEKHLQIPMRIEKKKKRRANEGTLLEQIVRMFLGETDEPTDPFKIKKSDPVWVQNARRAKLIHIPKSRGYWSPTGEYPATHTTANKKLSTLDKDDPRAKAPSGAARELPSWYGDGKPTPFKDISASPSDRGTGAEDLVDSAGLAAALHISSESSTNLYANLNHENASSDHKWNMGGAGASYGESQTTELGNRMWRGEVPPPNKEEYIQQQVDAICGDSKNEQTCRAIGGAAKVSAWSEVAYRGAIAQNEELDQIIKEHGLPNQPEGFPAQMQMNPEGEAIVKKGLNDARSRCTDKACEAHYDYQLERLAERKDTDTFALWVNGEGNVVCTKITNKQSLSDIRFNTTVKQRIQSIRDASDRLSAERTERTDALQGIREDLQPIHDRAVEVSVSGNLSYNATVSETLSDQRGEDGEGSNALDETPDTVLNGSVLEPYFNRMRLNGGKSPVIRGIASSMYPDTKWDDLTNRQLAMVAERSTGISKDDIRKVCDDNDIGSAECNKALGVKKDGTPSSIAGLGASYGNGPMGISAKLVLNVGVATADVRSKTTTQIFGGKVNPLKKSFNEKMDKWDSDHPSADFDSEESRKQARTRAREDAKAETLKEFKSGSTEDREAYSDAISGAAKSVGDSVGYPADDVVSVLENDKIRKLEGAKASRDETMKQAHQIVIDGHQNADLEYALAHREQYNPPLNSDSTDEEVRQHIENTPEDQLASRIYVETFMEEMHWNDYMDVETDYDILENTDGIIVRASTYRECFAKLTEFKSEDDSDSPEWRDGLRKHMRNNMELSSESNSVRFVNGDTSFVLGHDTYRNAGDGQKLEGKSGKELQECLDSRKDTSEAIRPLLRSLIIRELDRIRNGN